MGNPYQDFSYVADVDKPHKNESYLLYLRDAHPFVFDGMDDAKIKDISVDLMAIKRLCFATQVVHSVVEKSYESPDKPIYLGVGEDHANPDDIVTKSLILRGLTCAGLPLHVNVEYNPDTYFSHVMKSLNSKVDAAAFKTSLQFMQFKDKDFLAKAMFSEINWRYAPYASKVFDLQLYDGASAGCFDMIYGEPETFKIGDTSYIDFSSLDVIKRLVGQDDARAASGMIDAKSRLGMFFRNVHACEMLPKNGVVVDFQGSLHLAGDSSYRYGLKENDGDYNLPFSHSKMFLAGQAGYSVVCCASSLSRSRLPSLLTMPKETLPGSGVAVFQSGWGEFLLNDLPMRKQYFLDEGETLADVMSGQRTKRIEEIERMNTAFAQFGFSGLDNRSLSEKWRAMNESLVAQVISASEFCNEEPQRYAASLDHDSVHEP